MSTTLEFPIIKGSGLSGSVRVPPNLVRLPRGGRATAELATIRILSEDGDDRITWRPWVLDDIRAAKKLFDDLVCQGMMPHAIGPDGGAGEVMDEFDPTAGEILFTPVNMLRGG